jgi:hypothetical protein
VPSLGLPERRAEPEPAEGRDPTRHFPGDLPVEHTALRVTEKSGRDDPGVGGDREAMPPHPASRHSRKNTSARTILATETR